jgi:hypothetical protein
MLIGLALVGVLVSVVGTAEYLFEFTNRKTGFYFWNP